MQRAAAGLAHVVLDLLGRVYGARVLLLVGAGNNGGDALYAGALLAGRGARVEALLLRRPGAPEAGLSALRAAGGRVVQDLGEVAPADVGSCRRDRRHRRARWAAARAAGRGRRAAAAGALVVAVDVLSGVDARHRRGRRRRSAGRPDGHLRHPEERHWSTPGPGHAVRSTSSTSGSSCHRPRSSCCRPTTSRRCCRGPRPVGTSTPAAWSVSRPAPRSTPAPRCCASGAPCTALSRHGALPGRRLPTWCGPPTPRSSSARAGCRPGWWAPVAARTPRRRCGGRSADGVPLVVDADALAHVHRTRRVPVLLTPHAGELARMIGVARAEVEARPAAARPGRAARGTTPWCCSRDDTRWSPRRRAGAGDPDGHRGSATAVAGRRARRAVRGAAGRRARPVRRRLGRRLAARSGRRLGAGGGRPVTAGGVVDALPEAFRPSSEPGGLRGWQLHDLPRGPRGAAETSSTRGGAPPRQRGRERVGTRAELMAVVKADGYGHGMVAVGAGRPRGRCRLARASRCWTRRSRSGRPATPAAGAGLAGGARRGLRRRRSRPTST